MKGATLSALVYHFWRLASGKSTYLVVGFGRDVGTLIALRHVMMLVDQEFGILNTDEER